MLLLFRRHDLYIIYGRSIDKYYIGESRDPKVRLELHNEHYFKKNYTKAAEDWKIVLSKKYTSREAVVYLEKFMKCMKSKKFIEKVVGKPEILDKLLSKK